MRKTGGSFQPWSDCQRCGFLYPLTMLVSQKGLRVCTLFCLDNLDIEYRPYQIQQVLNSVEEEKVPQTAKIMWNPEELRF